MSREVIVNNTSFIIPEPSDQNYAEDLTEYLAELSITLGSLLSPLDILQTSFIFNDGEGNGTDPFSGAAITNFALPTTNITKFTGEYTITRRMPESYDSPNTRAAVETGTLKGTKTQNNDWNISRIDTDFDSDGLIDLATGEPILDIGVLLDMDDSDQLYYTSTDFGTLIGVGMDEGIFTFKVRTLEQ